jgi:uncharacterized cofD-like protein
MSKKKVCIIGGGNGSAKSIRSLKKYSDDFELSAVISMSDSGGSSGRLREEFGMLPPGDIMRAILAMSRHVKYRELRQVFYKNRFEGAGKLDGHNIGNLFLAFAMQYTDSLPDALSALHQSVGAVGTVHPVTMEATDITVEYENGTTVTGEHDIDRPEQRDSRIATMTLTPSVKGYKPALEAIKNADAIVIGPGSLYCSLAACLLVEGVSDAIAESNAQLIYVAGDAYEKDGELGPTTLSGFIADLEQFLPRSFDAILFSDNNSLSDEQLKKYDDAGWMLMEDDVDGDMDGKLVRKNLQRSSFGLGSPYIGEALRDIILNFK